MNCKSLIQSYNINDNAQFRDLEVTLLQKADLLVRDPLLFRE